MKITGALFADAPLARRMLEISPAAVAVLDEKGAVVFVSGSLCDLLGFSADELVGHSAALFLPEALTDHGLPQPLSHSAHSSHTAIHDGSRNKAIFAVNNQGGIVPVLLSFHEITGTQQTYRLIHLVRAGQGHVDHQVLQSERLAAIAQMISGLAHESRNAMQKAIASLDLLELDFKGNPEQLRLADRIRKSLAELLENYDEVRRYAQPVAINPERVKLEQLFHDASNELRAKRDTVPYQLRIGRANPCSDVACVDRVKMTMVFHHLLENAIDATVDPAVIDVDFTSEDCRNLGGLTFSVRDYGSGFNDVSLTQAFEPFFTTKQHGTGLGLAICRRIIEAHRGTIVAANHEGGGAVVSITLPGAAS